MGQFMFYCFLLTTLEEFVCQNPIMMVRHRVMQNPLLSLNQTRVSIPNWNGGMLALGVLNKRFVNV